MCISLPLLGVILMHSPRVLVCACVCVCVREEGVCHNIPTALAGVFVGTGRAGSDRGQRWGG